MKSLIAMSAVLLVSTTAALGGPIENTTEQQIGRIQADGGTTIYVTPKSPSTGWGSSSCKNVAYAWFNITGKNHWISILQMAMAMNRKIQMQVECSSNPTYAEIKYITIME